MKLHELLPNAIELRPTWWTFETLRSLPQEGYEVFVVVPDLEEPENALALKFSSDGIGADFHFGTMSSDTRMSIYLNDEQREQMATYDTNPNLLIAGNTLVISKYQIYISFRGLTGEMLKEKFLKSADHALRWRLAHVSDLNLKPNVITDKAKLITEMILACDNIKVEGGVSKVMDNIYPQVNSAWWEEFRGIKLKWAVDSNSQVMLAYEKHGELFYVADSGAVGKFHGNNPTTRELSYRTLMGSPEFSVKTVIASTLETPAFTVDVIEID
ncbi:hypothetical protein [Vibrio phage vB_VmeM-Yong XC32]|nr:hypothetical protein [Vibrio phage vB_VmeM-Yong XC31]QAX96536.1 hypothetical protein [Vibrio phage vB_VmeM-Yong XC32]QAX96854.1 hypothetical protein [Vibrio phage vB_VmeM-Yong MS31]QAX97159.1 hypothetical protein [Vibrio phage vB_VmeM-Yong MS32]